MQILLYAAQEWSSSLTHSQWENGLSWWRKGKGR